jgi:HSP20 family protein
LSHGQLRQINGATRRLAYSETSVAGPRQRNPPLFPTEDTTMTNLRLLDPAFDNFEGALRRFFPATLLESDPAPLKMRIDVTENDRAFTIKADIPGVKKEDINVRVEGNMVQIDAESKSEKETKGNGDKVLRSERHYGSISRSFSLGQEVDEGKAQAKYTDGVLTLELPKKAPAPSSKIAIQ